MTEYTWTVAAQEGTLGPYSSRDEAVEVALRRVKCDEPFSIFRDRAAPPTKKQWRTCSPWSTSPDTYVRYEGWTLEEREVPA